jgi:hypothetical protein
LRVVFSHPSPEKSEGWSTQTVLAKSRVNHPPPEVSRQNYLGFGRTPPYQGYNLAEPELKKEIPDYMWKARLLAIAGVAFSISGVYFLWDISGFRSRDGMHLILIAIFVGPFLSCIKLLFSPGDG